MVVSSPLIRLISLYAAVRAVDGVLPSLMLARRRERFLFWYGVLQLIAMPGAAVLGAVWDGAAGMIVFYTAAYCAVMIFLAKEALAELKGKISKLWSQTWQIMAATAVMTVIVLLLGNFAVPTHVDSPSLRSFSFPLLGQ